MVIWERFTTKKIVVNGKEKLESRCEIWKYKWNTKWNKLCVKIVGLLSFTLLIAYIIYKIISSSDTYAEMNEKHLKLQYRKLNSNEQCTYTSCSEYGYDDLCCFTCKGLYIDSNIINDIIIRHPDYDRLKCDYKLVLKLEECRYPKNKLTQNWYTDAGIPISQLVLIKGNIEDIEDGAFKSFPFFRLKRLTLQFPKIPIYRKDMFQGLSNLHWLEIQNSVPLSFKENVLEHVANTIVTLQVTQSELSDSKSIENLTSVEMPYLMDIDLQYNKLKSLPPHAFKNAPKLVALYLAENQLSILHESNFFSNKIGALSILNNKWICSCELYWLSNVENLIGVEATKCIDGKESYNFNSIFEMDCSNFSPTPPSTTSKTTTEEISSTTLKTTTEEISSTTLKTTTEEISSSSPSTLKTTTEEIASTSPSTISETSTNEIGSTPPPTTEKISSTSSTIMPTQEETSTKSEEPGDEISSTIETEEPTKDALPSSSSTDNIWIPEVENICTKNMVKDLNTFERNGKQVVQYPKANKTATYFFFNSRNIEDCNISLHGQIEGYFEPNTSYAFCEISNINELHCISGRTLPIHEEQTWMTNRNKIPVILIGIFVNLFSIVISGVLTYFCLKKHPSLLRGSNEDRGFVVPSRPIYLTSSKPRFVNDELTLRRQAPFVPVREPSVAYLPVGDASYFSPISERYMYVRQKPILHRSVSDLSLKTVASYVTENQIMSWRKRSKKERTPVTKLFEEPPPLPPPRNRCDVILQENEILAQSSREFW